MNPVRKLLEGIVYLNHCNPIGTLNKRNILFSTVQARNEFPVSIV